MAMRNRSSIFIRTRLRNSSHDERKRTCLRDDGSNGPSARATATPRSRNQSRAGEARMPGTPGSYVLANGEQKLPAADFAPAHAWSGGALTPHRDKESLTRRLDSAPTTDLSSGAGGLKRLVETAAIDR